MSTYVVGDVQGCYEPLSRLLEHVKFSAPEDTLVSVGDLINRGPDNLGVVRLARSLGDCFRGVLGNHELSFLASAHGKRQLKRSDTTADLMQSAERGAIVDWFRSLPLARLELNHLVVHAGVAPDWSLDQTLLYSQEVSTALQGDTVSEYLEHMYGDKPARFESKLTGYPRLRAITNVLTRIRFCSSDGVLDLDNKLGPEHARPGTQPWFSHPNRVTRTQPIVFGHWATLDGRAQTPNVYALDTGCVWGKQLTCLRLEDHKYFTCGC